MHGFLKSLFLMLAVWGLFMANSCRPTDSLPAPTTEGLNTFGCKINGNTWIPDGVRNDQGPAAKPIDVEFRRLSASTFYLFIYTNASTKDRVQLSMPQGKIGVNLLDYKYDEPFAIYYDNNFRLFTSNAPNSGKIVITRLDTLNRIVSGTFEFEGQDIVSKRKVSVTEGRFDIDMDKL